MNLLYFTLTDVWGWDLLSAVEGSGTAAGADTLDSFLLAKTRTGTSTQVQAPLLDYDEFHPAPVFSWTTDTVCMKGRPGGVSLSAPAAKGLSST